MTVIHIFTLFQHSYIKNKGPYVSQVQKWVNHNIHAKFIHGCQMFYRNILRIT